MAMVVFGRAKGKDFSVAWCTRNVRKAPSLSPKIDSSWEQSQAPTSQLLRCQVDPRFRRVWLVVALADCRVWAAKRVTFALSHGNGTVYMLERGRRDRHKPSMHLLYIARSQQLLRNLYELLDDFLDPRMYAGLHTTASAPSLRASEPYAMMAPQPIADDPGNVKVVVRCRAFVRRGEQTCRLQPT